MNDEANSIEVPEERQRLGLGDDAIYNNFFRKAAEKPQHLGSLFEELNIDKSQIFNDQADFEDLLFNIIENDNQGTVVGLGLDSVKENALPDDADEKHELEKERLKPLDEDSKMLEVKQSFMNAIADVLTLDVDQRQRLVPELAPRLESLIEEYSPLSLDSEFLRVSNLADLGSKLTKIRKMQKLTQKELAVSLGDPYQEIGRRERGEGNVTWNKLQAHLDALGFDIGIATQ